MEGRVVVNLSCSTLVRRIAEALGCRVTVKPVGFKYIAAEMKKGGVLIGGEEAGGIGIAAHMPERDGILACLILCELMAKTTRLWAFWSTNSRTVLVRRVTVDAICALRPKMPKRYEPCCRA